MAVYLEGDNALRFQVSLMGAAIERLSDVLDPPEPVFTVAGEQAGALSWVQAREAASEFRYRGMVETTIEFEVDDVTDEAREMITDSGADLSRVSFDDDPNPNLGYGMPYTLEDCWREGCANEVDRTDEVGLCGHCQAVLRGDEPEWGQRRVVGGLSYDQFEALLREHQQWCQPCRDEDLTLTTEEAR